MVQNVSSTPPSSSQWPDTSASPDTGTGRLTPPGSAGYGSPSGALASLNRAPGSESTRHSTPQRNPRPLGSNNPFRQLSTTGPSTATPAQVQTPPVPTGSPVLTVAAPNLLNLLPPELRLDIQDYLDLQDHAHLTQVDRLGHALAAPALAAPRRAAQADSRQQLLLAAVALNQDQPLSAAEGTARRWLLPLHEHERPEAVIQFCQTVATSASPANADTALKLGMDLLDHLGTEAQAAALNRLMNSNLVSHLSGREGKEMVMRMRDTVMNHIGQPHFDLLFNQVVHQALQLPLRRASAMVGRLNAAIPLLPENSQDPARDIVTFAQFDLMSRRDLARPR